MNAPPLYAAGNCGRCRTPAVRRPVRGEVRDRRDLLAQSPTVLPPSPPYSGASTSFFCVRVEVAVRPAVVAALLDLQQLFRRQVRALLGV